MVVIIFLVDYFFIPRKMPAVDQNLADFSISPIAVFLVRAIQILRFCTNTLTLDLHSGRPSAPLAGAATAMGPLCTSFTIVGLEAVTVYLS